jgi:hypothetical protein
LFEHRRQPLLSKRRFVARVLRHLGFTLLIVIGSLGVGVLGYHLIARQGWIDAFLNASMILGGMGPVDILSSNAAKVFAALYALFAGMVFLVAVGVLLAPVIHRFYHRFHLEAEER